MKKLMCFTAVLALALLNMSAYAQQEEHLVGLYLFDDEDGDEVIDSSGNGNNGVFQGGVERTDGKFGGGLEFNGVDAFVEIPDSESLAATDGLTIAMWIYLRSYSTAGGTGVTKGQSYKAGTRDSMKMMIGLTTVDAGWGNNVLNANTDVPLEEWHHVAATYDAASGDAIVYLDGEEDGRAEYSGEIVPNTDVVWIGRGGTPYFDGIYDEVAIWNAALSQAEIAHAMNSLHAVELAGKLTTTWAGIKAQL